MWSTRSFLVHHDHIVNVEVHIINYVQKNNYIHYLYLVKPVHIGLKSTAVTHKSTSGLLANRWLVSESVR